MSALTQYRGRLAPSPTGFLHLGHARTFWVAQARARLHKGILVLRNEDLDKARGRTEYVEAMLEDLAWFGFRWQEGPDVGGPYAPYSQSERYDLYTRAFATLRDGGFIYPCACSRQDVLRALGAPHLGDDEPLYPGTCRGNSTQAAKGKGRWNWRFRVPDGEEITFCDGHHGTQRFVAGRDFGDFIVWRHDAVPSYQLAVVVDDAAMQISEVVRGADLLRSAARQILLYRALRQQQPRFWHCPLLLDTAGNRLAKRHDSLSLRALRAQGAKPEKLRAGWDDLALPNSEPGAKTCAE